MHCQVSFSFYFIVQSYFFIKNKLKRIAFELPASGGVVVSYQVYRNIKFLEDQKISLCFPENKSQVNSDSYESETQATVDIT